MSADYITRRMDKCHAEIVKYCGMSTHATTASERRLCDEMVRMYKKRYEWYINKLNRKP